jgi:lysophospholipase L1-like esterase
MSSFSRRICYRHDLSRGFSTAPVLAVFILGLSVGILCMVMFPALYLDVSDRFSWRIRWIALKQMQLERSLIAVHMQSDPLVPSGAILLFGDSHLHRLPTSRLPGPAQNYAISGETAQQLNHRLALYRSIHHANQVILLTGRNDLSIDTPSSAIAATISQILTRIPSAVSTILLGIPPAVDPNARAVARKEINGLIEKQCAIRPSCRFISLDAFADDRGQLQSQFDSGDGIHLNANAYAMLLDVLTNPHLGQIPSLHQSR